MIASKLRLSITKISLLTLSESTDPFERVACRLKWKQNKLWVKALDSADAVQLPAMTHTSWLQDCLQHSQVEAVCLDHSISQLDLNRWLAACAEANKPIFLRLPASPVFPERQNPASWRAKRLADRLAALLLLVGLSPLWLSLGLWLQLTSAGKVSGKAAGGLLERHWRVGQRGRLFQMLKFRTFRQRGRSGASDGLIPIGHWIQRCRLDDLPQLLNVLNGEMSLVGPRPWTPAEALRYPDRLCPNALPGMIGSWSQQTALETYRQPSPDWDYLRGWSLSEDLRLLTRATFRFLGNMLLFRL